MSVDPYEDRKTFRKLSVIVPQEMYEKLILEAARRKIEGEHGHLLSDMLREAVVRYLEKLGRSVG